MSQTYSTRQRALSGGQLFSSRFAAEAAPTPMQRQVAVAVAPAVPIAPVTPTPQAPPPPPLPEERFNFVLTPQGVVPAPPGAANAKGAAAVTGRPGSAYMVAASLTGLPPHRDPSLQPTLWLIHDLTVPHDLAPADLAHLPKGVGLTGNRPGAVFTVDGNNATYGKNSNTLSIAISPGTFTAAGPADWTLTSAIDQATNQAFHPLVVLGPSALADINLSLPSGTVARILTDLFMRTATVHPDLSLKNQFNQRLAAVVQEVLTAPDAVAYLPPGSFKRAAVTLEGIVRGTARLQPTREACVLIGSVG